jgi:hypothetical protein
MFDGESHSETVTNRRSLLERVARIIKVVADDFNHLDKTGLNGTYIIADKSAQGGTIQFHASHHEDASDGGFAEPCIPPITPCTASVCKLVSLLWSWKGVLIFS